LTDWIRAVADQLAAEGFIAVAPDFLSGKGPGGKGTSSVDADGARALIGKLESAEIIRRLNATAAYAISLPAARKQYAVLGFCWGGGISFTYATVQPNLVAAVVYYGTSPATETLARIKAPVLGAYGGSDARVNATIPPAQAEMNRLGKSYTPELYDGAGHAFLRVQDGQSGANRKATQQAWPRTVQFLKTSLGDAVSLETGAASTVAAAALDIDCVCEEDAAAFVAEAAW
jgi:carboxymethylenebutenolidase